MVRHLLCADRAGAVPVPLCLVLKGASMDTAAGLLPCDGLSDTRDFRKHPLQLRGRWAGPPPTHSPTAPWGQACLRQVMAVRTVSEMKSLPSKGSQSEPLRGCRTSRKAGRGRDTRGCMESRPGIGIRLDVGTVVQQHVRL